MSEISIRSMSLDAISLRLATELYTKAAWMRHAREGLGMSLKTLANDIDTLLDHQLTNDQTLLAFYAKRGIIHVLDVDPATREARSEQTLPAHD